MKSELAEAIHDRAYALGFKAAFGKENNEALVRQNQQYEEAKRVGQREYYYDLDSLRFVIKHFTRQTTKLDSKGCCYAIGVLMSRIHKDITEDERQVRIIELKAKQLKEGF